MTDEHHSQKVATLETRVGAIEGTLDKIGLQLEKLASLITSKGQTNWQHIISAGSLLTAILTVLGAALYAPILSAQTRNEAALAAMIVKTDNRFEKLLARVEAGDERIKSSMVPRSEHELFVKFYERSLDRIIKRLDHIDGIEVRLKPQARLANP